MPEFGFPAQPRQASLASIIAKLRDRADDARFAAVTGRNADVTRELDGRVSELMQIEKSINDLQSYSEAIALSEARANVMQQSLGRIGAVSQSLTDTVDLLGTNGTDRDFESLSLTARGELQTVVASLNASFGGRALFAGDVTATPTVADADTIFASSVPFLEGAASSTAAYAALEAEFVGAGGLFDTAIYQGGAGNPPRTEIAAGEQVDYGVKANEDPMRRALLNVVVLAAAYDTSNAIPDEQRRDLARIANEGLREGIGSLVTVQGRLGAAEARIANIKSRNIATEASLTLNYNELAGADTYQAALSLSELDTQLETAFATTARLADLTLANFR